MLDMTCLAVDVLVTRRDHLQKRFYNVSYSCNTCTMSTTRELLLYDKQSFSGTNSGIRKWVLDGSWTSVSALRIPLHKKTALKNAATAALLSLWKSTVARVVCFWL